MSFIVAIDGPAGTGKSTSTKGLAKKLNLTNIDTGATYRCVALETINKGIKLEEKDKIVALLDNINIDFKHEGDKELVFLNGEDVTEKIRSMEVNQIVSQVSSIKEVRYKMVELQRRLAEGKNVILEGRDIGTYVFPNADIKIYLDADPMERAKRRYREMQEKNIKGSLEEVYNQILMRDKNDMEKEIGALKKAEDAIVIDTTKFSLEEQIQEMEKIVKKQMEEKNIG